MSNSHSSLGDPVGLFRDGDLLVVNMTSHRFPQRCVADNSTNDVICVDLHRPLLDRDTSWFLLLMMSTVALFTLGRATFVVRMGERPPVNMGVSRQKFESWQSARWTGRLIGILGGLLMIGSVVAYVFCVMSNHMAIADVLILPLFPLGILMAIGGVVYLMLYEVPILKLEKTEGGHEWYSGACPEYLAALPVKR